jgi:hypothetical protein
VTQLAHFLTSGFIVSDSFVLLLYDSNKLQDFVLGMAHLGFRVETPPVERSTLGIILLPVLNIIEGKRLGAILLRFELFEW